MGQKASSSHHHPADDAHGGHHAPAETEEQRRDAEHAREVELKWSRALRIPGAVLALVLAALSLGWLASLGRSAPSMSWAWLPLLVLGLAWALALARGGREEPVEEPPPAAHH